MENSVHIRKEKPHTQKRSYSKENYIGGKKYKKCLSIRKHNPEKSRSTCFSLDASKSQKDAHLRGNQGNACLK